MYVCTCFVLAYIYTYPHICITHIHTHTHTHVHTHPHICIHTHTYTHTHNTTRNKVERQRVGSQEGMRFSTRNAATTPPPPLKPTRTPSRACEHTSTHLPTHTHTHTSTRLHEGGEGGNWTSLSPCGWGGERAGTGAEEDTGVTRFMAARSASASRAAFVDEKL